MLALITACGPDGGPGPGPGPGGGPPQQQEDGGAGADGGQGDGEDGGTGSGGEDGGTDGGPKDGGSDAGTDGGTPEPEKCTVPVSQTAPRDGTWTLPPLQTCIQEYHLTMPAQTLQSFYDDPYAPEQQATFTVDGVAYPAEVELRGQTARHFPKKSWNVDLNDGRFEGRRRLNLIASYADQTLLTEKLAYDILHAMGVAAPRAKFVRLYVNGKYEGVFIDLEQVDKHFTKARFEFEDNDPTIYRTPSKDNEMKTWRGSHQGKWDKKTNEDEPQDDIQALMQLMNWTPEPRFESQLSSRFDLEGFILGMTMDVLISNSYHEDSQSYLIHDRDQDLWRYVPWDLNNNDARWWHTYPLETVDYPYFKHPLVNFTITDKNVEYIYNRRVNEMCGTSPCYPGYLPTFSNLGSRIVLNPVLNAKLEAFIQKAQQDFFTEAKVHARLDETYNLIAPHVIGQDEDHIDPYVDHEKFKLGPKFVKSFITQRIAFVNRSLADGRPRSPLILTAVDPAEGWVELKNQSAEAIDLGGRTLTTNLRHGLLKNLPAQVLQPGETTRIHLTALGILMEPNGEVGLFDGVTILGFHDALWYGQLEAGQIYARDAQGQWQIVPRQ